MSNFREMTPQWLPGNGSRKAVRKNFKLLKYEHIIYVYLKHVTWRFQICNYFRDFMNTLTNFAKSFLLIFSQNLRAILCKSHLTCDSRVFRISSCFNQLKTKVILEYGRNFSFIKHFVEFLGGRETTVIFQQMQSVSTSYILKATSAPKNCFSGFKLLLHVHEAC